MTTTELATIELTTTELATTTGLTETSAEIAETSEELTETSAELTETSAELTEATTKLAIDNSLQSTEQLLNLKALLHNYEFLLGKATGFTELKLASGKLLFLGMNSDNEAHKLLVDFLMNFATEKKQIKTREALRPDNERFAFRTWLIRLGWKGRETSKLRVSLYKNLSGNSAFCTEASKSRWLEKYGKRSTKID